MDSVDWDISIQDFYLLLLSAPTSSGDSNVDHVILPRDIRTYHMH